MQLKHVNKQFGSGFKPSHKDYLRVVGRKYKKMMAWIEGRESKNKKKKLMFHPCIIPFIIQLV
jgi:hypothetical protein